jgi:hypothetical protein
MARILEFKPRWHAPDEPLTPEQNLEKLRKRTLDTVRDLVSYYNSTGRWNDSCEPHVIRAIEELYIVCNKLAGAEHAESAPRIG